MMLRKTGFVLLSCAAIAATLASAVPSFAMTVTMSEAPATYYEISPTSTRWRVERGGRLVPISASRVKYMRVATYHNPAQWAAVPMSPMPMGYDVGVSVYPQNQMMPMAPQYGVPGGAPAPNTKANVNAKHKPKTSKAPSSPQNRRNQPSAPNPNQGGQTQYMPVPVQVPSQQAAPIPQTMPAANPQMIPSAPQGYYQAPQVQAPYAGQAVPNQPQMPQGYYQEPRQAPVPQAQAAPQTAPSPQRIPAPGAVPRPPAAPSAAPAQQPNDYTRMLPPVEKRAE